MNRRFQAYNLAEERRRIRQEREAVAMLFVILIVLLVVSGLGLPPR